jgi:hypothetical protein
MVRIVGVIGDEGTDNPKLIVGCFLSEKSVGIVGNETILYISEKNPYLVFDAAYGSIETPGPLSRYQGRVELKGGKGPQYYYPTFDQPIDKKDPENTFKIRCTSIIYKHAKELHDAKNVEKEILISALKRYNDVAKRFMHKTEDLFDLNGIPL